MKKEEGWEGIILRGETSRKMCFDMTGWPPMRKDWLRGRKVAGFFSTLASLDSPLKLARRERSGKLDRCRT
jgi:hypothetical protein